MRILWYKPFWNDLKRKYEKNKLTGELFFIYFPVTARRHFDVDTTLFGCQQRCYDVKTTSRAG